MITRQGLFTAARRPVPLAGRRLALDPGLLAHEALCFLDARSRALAFEAPDGSAIELEASGFAHWALWAPAGAPLLSIEAWTGHGDTEGYRGEFSERPSTRTLAPRATARHGLTLRFRTGGGAAMIEIAVACPGPDLLGEGPQWHVAEQRLYWVDAFAPAIRRLDPRTGAVESFGMPCDVGSFVFCRDGRLVAATREGFQRVRLVDGCAACDVLADPLARDRRLLLNDGKCDRRGRYWCASLHSDFVGRQGELYRLDAELQATRMDGDFIVGNGIAFSPDDTRMYLADSRDETVWVYDFDLERGTLSDKRVFFSTRDIEGRVDGATCDRDGNYWCALVHGAAVACISPAGRMIERLAVPCRHPTMVTFGGADLDRMYVTTATRMLADDERARWPLAGALLRIDGLGAKGVPEPFFANP